MITGRVQHRIATFNTFAPLDDQPYVVVRKYTLVANVEQEDDFTVGQMDHILPFVQSCFIDNALNANPLSIYFPISDYTLRVASNGQGTFPVYSPMPFKPRLTLAGANGSVEILWANFAQPYAQWVAV